MAVTLTPPSGSTFPLGTTMVSATATDAAGNTASGSFAVTVVDTTAPTLQLPAPQVIPATQPGGAVANFTATATDIVDSSVAVGLTPPSGSLFALGTTPVVASATDFSGNTATGAFTVTVNDSTPPTLASVSAQPNTLWPANHQWVRVTISAQATDQTGLASLRIVSVSSNEPVNGLGDGDTSPDWIIRGDLAVDLRAERSGKGHGRVYSIVVEARDSAGNSARATTTVTVPKNQGGKDDDRDDKKDKDRDDKKDSGKKDDDRKSDGKKDNRSDKEKDKDKNGRRD